MAMAQYVNRFQELICAITSSLLNYFARIEKKLLLYQYRYPFSPFLLHENQKELPLIP